MLLEKMLLEQMLLEQIFKRLNIGETHIDMPNVVRPILLKEML
jgi:hypothetical protein